jgi:hypothetical protein
MVKGWKDGKGEECGKIIGKDMWEKTEGNMDRIACEFGKRRKGTCQD